MNTCENNLERQVNLWSMPGPAAILVTLFVISITSPTESIPFSLIAIAGFLASWFWKVNGAAVSLTVLILYMGVYFLLSGFEYAFWLIGSVCALVLAWVITALSREEIHAVLNWKPPVLAVQPLLEPVLALEPKPEPKQDNNEAEERILVLQDELEAVYEEVAALQKQGEQYPIAVKQLQSEHSKTVAALKANLEALKQEKEKEEIQSKESAVVWGDPATKEGRALCKVEGMYQQLRGQYEDKSIQLDQTRKELFHVQEQITVIQKEREEEVVYGQSTTEKALEAYLKTLIATVDRLETENRCLEELVSQLI